MTALAKKNYKLVHYLYPDAASKRNKSDRFSVLAHSSLVLLWSQIMKVKRDMRRNENKTEGKVTANAKLQNVREETSAVESQG